MFILAGGQCTIATYPGNARDMLAPDIISDETVESCDIILAQGSLWYKFEHTLPTVCTSCVLCMKNNYG